MSGEPRRLGNLPHSVDALIQTLLGVADEDGELPRVTLHLRGGREVFGYLIARVEERSQAAYVVEGLPEDRFRRSEARTYVPVGEVQALTLVDSAALEAKLEAKKPAPTKLELQRIALEAGKKLAAVLGTSHAFELDWATLPSNGDATRAVAELVRRTGGALLATSSDALGKEALGKLAKVVIAGGPAVSAKREGDALHIAGPVKDGAGAVPSEGALQEAVDAAL